MAKENKKSRPFKAPDSLLAESDRLAKAYGISWNTLVTLCLENAVEEWAVPNMEPVAEPGQQDEDLEQEKALQ